MARPRVDYLVGGLRISLAATNTSPGPRTHILGFTKSLRSSGYEVNLVLASEMPFMGRFAKMGSTRPGLASPSRLFVADLVRILTSLWVGVNTFVRSVGRPAPVFIYERAAVMTSVSSFHAAKRRTIRVVEANGILSRETADDRGALRSKKFAAWIERRVFRNADLLVVVSENLKAEVMEFTSLQADRILVVPNGIDDELARRPRQGGSHLPTIGFVGQLSSWQQLELLVSASHELRDMPFNVEIIGDGVQRGSLERLVREYGIENRVRILGRLPQQQAFERMLAWDIGFAGHIKSSSDRMYHSPLKLYEYAALGLDVVASDSEDAHALMQSGLRVEVYSEARPLADALKAALRLPRLDAEELTRRRLLILEQHGWGNRVKLVTERIALLDGHAR